MNSLTELLLLLVAWVVLPTSVIGWIVFVGKKTQGHVLVPWQARHPVPWKLIDLLLAIFVSGLTVAIAQRSVARYLNVDLAKLTTDADQLEPKLQFALLLGMSIGLLLATLFTIALIRLRTRASMQDLGFSVGKLPRDLAYGFCGFVMLIVPMMLIQLRLVPPISAGT